MLNSPKATLFGRIKTHGFAFFNTIIMETSHRRDRIALYLIGFSFCAIIIISVVLIYFHEGKREEASWNIFNALLPLISTWVGTVLVFYFGRENFEAASKRYEQIINKLSPEILGGVTAQQVMIDKFTMVSLDVTDPRMANFSAQKLLDFLDDVQKSRLPILSGGKVKYIIHKSLLNEETRLNSAESDQTFTAFVARNPIVAQFGIIKQNDSVDTARKLIRDNQYKDVFVVDDAGLVVGWLTDSHMIRYMKVD